MKYRNLKITFEIDNIAFTVLSISRDSFEHPIPKHSHSKNSYEFHYITSGYGTLIADMKKYDIIPGSFYVTGPGVEHEQISSSNNPMLEYGIYLQISPDTLPPPNSPMDIFTQTKFWIGMVNEDISLLMDKILKELEMQALGYESILPPMLKYLMLLIIRLYSHTDSASHVKEEILPQDLIYLTIEEAFLYEYKDITLELLADRVGLGTRQTERLLKNHYSKTFSQMKCDARMSAASLLLVETTKGISTIADELGYSSSEHFSNSFKKYFGTRPGNFRRQ